MRFPIRRNSKPKDNTKSYVYSITCPNSNEVVYIGFTINVKSRFSYHLNNGFEKNKKALWIRGLLNNNLTPIFKVVGEFNTITEGKEFESREIKRLKPLLNTK